MNERMSKLTSKLSVALTVGICACGSVFAELPAGAVRMGGIKSSGCYVDTKYVPNSKTRVVMSFQMNALPVNTGAYAGLQETNNRQFMFGVSKTLQFRFAVTPAGGGSTIDIGPADGNPHEFDIASGLQKFDGEEYGRFTIDDGSTYPLYIFGMNNRWASDTYPQSITVYSCKIYEDGELVRNFIPCLYEGRARLWDDANGEWYDKSGNGTFEAVEGIKIDELENVFSDGQQYLKTGVVPTPKTRFELDFQMRSTQGTQMIGVLGDPCEKGQFFFSVNGSGNFASSVAASRDPEEGVITVGRADKKRHKLVMTSGSQTLDGVEYARQLIPEGVFEDQIYLFAVNDRSATGSMADGACCNCQMTFFGCRIYEGGELIRDYRPAMTAQGPAVVDLVSMRQGEPVTCTYNLDGSRLTRANAVVSYGESYVDTGVKLTPQTSVRVDFRLDKLEASQSIIGYQGGANGLAQLLFLIQDRTAKDDGICFVSTLARQDAGLDYNVAGPVDTDRHVLEIRPGSQKFDDVEYATEILPANVPAVTDGNLYLFAFNNRWLAAGASRLAAMHLYRCQIWEGDTLVRDFRPAVLPNGAGCLVDAASGYATYFGQGEFGNEPMKKGLAIILR